MPMFLSLLLLSKKDANIGRRIEAVAKVDVGGGALEQLETSQFTMMLSWIGRRKWGNQGWIDMAPLRLMSHSFLDSTLLEKLTSSKRAEINSSESGGATPDQRLGKNNKM